MRNRLLLWILGVYLGILFMAAFASADVGWASRNRTIKVMSIDTGTEMAHPIFKGREIGCTLTSDCFDLQGHGTSVASLILFGELDKSNKPTAEVCSHVEFHSCNYLNGLGVDLGYYKCLQEALDTGVQFVNFSSVAPGKDRIELEYLSKMANKGIKFITAFGNEGQDLNYYPTYPALYSRLKNLMNTIIPVYGITRDGRRWVDSNYGIPGKAEIAFRVRSAWMGGRYAEPSGTSMSTALHTNRLLRQECAK